MTDYVYNGKQPLRPIPDICTGFITKSEFDLKYPMFSHSYRVSGYYKAIPCAYEEYNNSDLKTNKLLNDIFYKIWLKNHPDFHHEYYLKHCRKEEATHVSGSGACGIIIAIDNPEVEFDYTFIDCPEKLIKERTEANEFRVAYYESDPIQEWPMITIKGAYHE